MLNLNTIERLATREQFQPLLDGVLENGRRLPLAARLLLSQESNLALAAGGMALQRVVELSYLPAPVAGQLARRLAGALLLAGQLAGDRRPSPGATAVAMAGLHDALDQAEATGAAMDDDLREVIEAGLEAGAYMLFEVASRSALLHPDRAGIVGSALDSALIAWQVGARPALARRLGGHLALPALKAQVEAQVAARDADVIAVMALAGLSAPAAPVATIGKSLGAKSPASGRVHPPGRTNPGKSAA
jgi:hypothetical protein